MPAIRALYFLGINSFREKNEMKFPLYWVLMVLALGSPVSSQSTIEQHVWQEARSFAPISRTADAITGTITLSGNPTFATEDSTMNMSFEKGASVALVSEGAFWRTWVLGSQGKQTAEVFRLTNDPGSLQNGNTLCGKRDAEKKLFAVFYEQSLFGGGDPSLTMAVFQSAGPPFNINSPGLCGTFTYAIDEMTVPADPAISTTEGAETGAWRIRTATNPIDDTQTVTLSLAAETGTSGSGDPVTFVARCKSNTTEAYVIWGDFLGNDSSDVYSKWKRVTIRVGAGQAREERWGISTSRNTTFAPSWAGNLLKELLDEEQLVLETIPYGQNPNTAIFNVSGLRGVLGQLAKTCNWTF